ncbi:MAG: hypothetical protein Ct9H300mP1_13440 [Planctomycetaceae bacterium]|nr:MAG: hypothetical protein Ct9H300mP1_13440 [Planctomycetaceae bacterium]
MATEEILMAGVRAGGDRQELQRRSGPQPGGRRGGQERGGENDLISRFQGDPCLPNRSRRHPGARPGLPVGRPTGGRVHPGVVDPIRDRYPSALQADGGEVTV